MSFSNSVIKAAEGKKVVFFDFWDTIVHRKVHADTIKQITSKKIAGDYYNDNMKKILYDIRVYAERYCYTTIGDFVYSEMEEIMNQHITNEGLNPLDVGSFERIEFETEIYNAYIDKDIIDLIVKLKRKGYKLYIISDFYMGSDSLHKILHSLGCGDFFDQIFVSCDCRCSKGSTELYKYVLKELSVNGSECLMIGDNYRSDYAKAKDCGIVAVHYHFKNRPLRRTKENIAKELLKIEKDKVENLYDNYAFCLFLFISRLYNEIHRACIKDLVFLSREGKYLKKLFDYYAYIKNDISIKTHYCYVSRRSTYLPSLNSIEKEDFETLFEIKDYSIAVFLKNLNFNDEEIETVRDELGFSESQMNMEIIDFRDSREFESLKTINTFIEIYEQKRVQTKSMLLRYINQFGIQYNKNGLYIVDVGWKGTMQDNIFRLFEKEVDVKGYYLGLTQLTTCDSRNQKAGLLLNYIPPESMFVREFGFNRLLFEDILQADHPSTKEYLDRDGVIEPVFDKKEDLILINHARILQDRIFSIYTIICELFQNTVFEPDDLEYTFAQISVNGIKKCKMKDINMFWEMSNAHYANFMTFRTSKETRERYTIHNKMNIIVGYLRRFKVIFSGEYYLKFCVGLKKAKLGWLIPIYLRTIYLIENREIKNKQKPEVCNG